MNTRATSVRLVVLAVLAASSLFACTEDGRGTNGADCIKNDDCESDHCISGKCRPKPQTSPGTGGSGTAGSGTAGSNAAGAGG